MNKIQKRIERPLTFAVISLFSFASLHAQNTTDDEDEEEVFTLSPFQVDGSQDVGYRGAATTAGSRLNTQLKDVAASVEVLTEAFLDDLGADDLSEALTMVAGADTELTQDSSDTTNNGQGFVSNNSNEQEGVVRVRGLGRAVNTLGYVPVRTSLNRYNISRAEFLRGANSILFGLGNAAGIVNYTPKTALLSRDVNKVSIKVDQFGSKRLNFDFSRALIEDKLAFRVNGLDAETKYMFDDAYWNDNRLFLTAQFKPTKNTKLNWGYETVKSSGARPNYTLLVDQTSDWLQAFGDAHAEAEANGGIITTEAGTFTWDEYVDRNFAWDPITNARGNNSGGVGPSKDLLTTQRGFLDTPEEARYRRVLDQGAQDIIAAFDNQDWNNPVDGVLFRAEPRQVSGSGQPTTGAVWKYPAPGEGGSRKRWPKAEKISHRAKYAQSRSPNEGIGSGFTDPQILDEGIFPYLDKDLASIPGNLRTIDDKKLFLNVEQKVNDDFYLQATYQKEEYNTLTRRVISNSTRQIAIDINRRIADGRENPNYLRPFLSGRQDERILQADSENFIAQATYQLDFAGKSDRLAFLGQHNFAALFSKTIENEVRYTQRPVILNNDEGSWDGYKVDGSQVGLRRIRQLWYIGPAVQPGDEQINYTGLPPTIAFDPTQYQNAVYNYYDETNESAQRALADEYGNNFYPEWSTYEDPLDIGNAVDRGAKFDTRKVDGLGLTLQSSLLGGRLRTVFGVRRDNLEQFQHAQLTQDEFASQIAGFSTLEELTAIREKQALHNDTKKKNTDISDVYPDTEGGRAARRADLALTGQADLLKWRDGNQDKSHFIRSSEADYAFEDVETTSAQVVYHINNQMRVFYNKSETFNLEKPRVDPLFNFIDPETGTTEEFGIGFQLLDNKLNMKLSFYEANAVNATSGSSRATISGIRNFENKFWNAYRQARVDYNAVYEEDDEIALLIEGTPALDDHLTPEVEAIEVFPIKAMRREDDGSITFLDAPYRNENGALQGKYISPNNAEATEDTTSKGFDFTSTYNPNRNLRLRFNFSRLENKVTKIGPELDTYLRWRAADIYQSFFLTLREGGKENWVYLSGARGRRAPAAVQQTTIKRFNDNISKNLLRARDRIDRSNPGISEYNARLTANYSFREGVLKGLSFGTNLRWESGKAIGYYLKDASFSIFDDYLTPEEQARWGDLSNLATDDPETNLDDNQLFPVPDIDNIIESDPIVTGGVKVGYKRKIMNDKVNWNIQLNVQNLFKQGDDLRVIRVNPDDTPVFGINRPTTYQLTNSFSW